MYKRRCGAQHTLRSPRHGPRSPPRQNSTPSRCRETKPALRFRGETRPRRGSRDPLHTTVREPPWSSIAKCYKRDESTLSEFPRCLDRSHTANLRRAKSRGSGLSRHRAVRVWQEVCRPDKASPFFRCNTAHSWVVLTGVRSRPPARAWRLDGYSGNRWIEWANLDG